ncbi:hypothetical protein GXW82_35720 [Streptacidiphilus sp. 4-A2]|nr:hypothetical protein [Streptacidiphilus sp. 4-A2]
MLRIRLAKTAAVVTLAVGSAILIPSAAAVAATSTTSTTGTTVTAGAAPVTGTVAPSDYIWQ